MVQGNDWFYLKIYHSFIYRSKETWELEKGHQSPVSPIV